MENTHTHALTISLSMEYQSFVAPQTRPDFDAKETYCAHYFTLWSIKPLDPDKLSHLLIVNELLAPPNTHSFTVSQGQHSDDAAPQKKCYTLNQTKLNPALTRKDSTQTAQPHRTAIPTSSHHHLTKKCVAFAAPRGTISRPLPVPCV
jgi:hypothetical protein